MCDNIFTVQHYYTLHCKDTDCSASIIGHTTLVVPWQPPCHCQCVDIGGSQHVSHSLRDDSSCCSSISCPGDGCSRTTSGDTGQGERWWISSESRGETELEDFNAHKTCSVELGSEGSRIMCCHIKVFSIYHCLLDRVPRRSWCGLLLLRVVYHSGISPPLLHCSCVDPQRSSP